MVNCGYTTQLIRYLWFTVSYYESTRVGLQFQYHDQYSIVTQALVLAPENVHISLMNTGETDLNCTELAYKVLPATQLAR